ncbi:MAG: hypothetical protein QW103_02935 [Candidatus Pacearchaeota archaeon]
MVFVSKTIISLIILLIGLSLGYASLKAEIVLWPLPLWAIIFIILGIYILFNKKEDEIEQIKIVKTNKKTKKRSKK